MDIDKHWHGQQHRLTVDMAYGHRQTWKDMDMDMDIDIYIDIDRRGHGHGHG